jgi:hypothetical protein
MNNVDYTNPLNRVAIWPSPWNYHLENRIFDEGFGPAGAYVNAFSLFRTLALQENWSIDTWDMVPAGAARVLWFIDLPSTRESFLRAKELFPGAITVLMVCESPLICPQMFNDDNRHEFDHVVSYEQKNGARLHSYRLPVPLAVTCEGPDFDDRRLLCMINSNRIEGLWAMRQQGLVGLPGIGRMFNGWRHGLKDWRRVFEGDLYPERRRLARELDKFPGIHVDFFGKGWDGSQISWFPYYPNAPYSRHRARFVDNRIGTLSRYRFSLAYENWHGSADYLTDRFFDALLAGVVPVYLGDSRIDDLAPPGSFVDARHFNNHFQLISHLSEMSRESWLELVSCGRSFLNTEGVLNFSEESFARRMFQILKTIAS